ncbi:MAG: hypothetical protein AVDCRST_MAG89-239, partial [uncultured Gemmatimonadetes bacterium]
RGRRAVRHGAWLRPPADGLQHRRDGARAADVPPRHLVAPHRRGSTGGGGVRGHGADRRDGGPRRARFAERVPGPARRHAAARRPGPRAGTRASRRGRRDARGV